MRTPLEPDSPGRRSARLRQRRPVFVFTEGEVTEPSYVDAIKNGQQDFVVRVDDRHGNPGEIVPVAIAFKREQDRVSREDRLPKDLWAEVWCLFDRDEHSDVDLWIKKAADACGAPSAGSCGRVTDGLCIYLPHYKKQGKRVTLSDLSGRYAAARQRAVLLTNQHDRDGVVRASQRDPSTNAYDLVDALGAEC